MTLILGSIGVSPRAGLLLAVSAPVHGSSVEGVPGGNHDWWVVCLCGTPNQPFPLLFQAWGVSGPGIVSDCV